VNTAFNNGKIKTFSFGTGDTSVAAILTKPTGNKFNVIGNYYNPTTWTGGAGVAQFLNTGPLDSSYNGNGIFTTNPGANKDEYTTGAVFTSTGGIDVSATILDLATVSNKKVFSDAAAEIISFRAGGGLNTSFGVGGRTKEVYASGSNFYFGTAIDMDAVTNKPMLAGTACNGLYTSGTPLPYGVPAGAIPSATKSFVYGARFTPAGAWDTTFSFQPFTYNTNWLAGVNTVHVDGSGGVIFSGGSGPLNGPSNIAVSYLNNTGGFNTFFNGTGKWTQAISGGYSGKINTDYFISHFNSLNYQDYYYDYFGGDAKLGTKQKWLLGQYEIRYQSPSFLKSPVVSNLGNNGLLTSKINDVTDGTSMISVGNNLYTGGDTALAGMKKYAFIKETSLTGGAISGFGTNGMLTYSLGNGDTTISRIATNSQDLFAVGTYVNNGLTYAYIRDWSLTGTLRTSFFGGGTRTFSLGQYTGISSMVIDQTNKKIDLAGDYFSPTSLSGGSAYLQLNYDGSYSTGFGTGGIFKPMPAPGKIEIASDLALDGTGGFYAAGTEFSVGLNSMFQPTILGSRMEVESISQAGKLRTIFGILGRAYSNYKNYPFAFATRIVYAPTTKIIYLGGTVANGFYAFGTPAPVGAPGSALPAATAALMAVTSLTAAGVLNTGFNGNGMQAISLGNRWLAGVSSMALLQNGDIALAGGADLNHTNSQIIRARLRKTGLLDTQYYTKGYYIQPVAGSSVGAFDYFIVPHYNASGFLDYYYGFYTGHEKIDSTLAYLLIGWDWWCDF